MTKEQIGSVLKELRLESGKTQKEVAGLLGRKQQIVGHWETGYAQPDANTLFTLCEIYGTTVDAAFGFKKKDIIISKKDLNILEKYHSLDDHGKELVDLVLNKEHSRCYDYIVDTEVGSMLVKSQTPTNDTNERIRLYNENLMAAHNDHADEPGELEKMQEDLANLKRP